MKSATFVLFRQQEKLEAPFSVCSISKHLNRNHLSSDFSGGYYLHTKNS